MLTTVASFAEPWNAHILRGRLEAEGLFAVVVHEHHVGLQWPWALALSGAKVQVMDDEREAALGIARRGQAGDYRRELEPVFGPLDDPCCPNCRSDRFTSRRPVSMLAMLAASYWYFGVIFPLRASVHRCGVCGTRWRDGVR